MTYQESDLVTKYISHYDAEVKRRLILLRKAIQEVFPSTIEDISYGIPTYRPAPKKRGIIHFGAAKDHIGIYAVLDGIGNEKVKSLMKAHQTGRGTLKFDTNKDFPIDDIKLILLAHRDKLLAK